ncbi:YbaB/EbfC family nucleoid-associated protein [Candidatus Mycoplasma pogonae]
MNINALMRQAKQMQAELDKKKEALNKQEFTFQKQGIEVVILGNHQIKSIKLHPVLIDPEDKETLEDLILVTLNEAHEEINELHEALVPKQGM